MSVLELLKKELKDLQNRRQAEVLARFFKTGQGEYGEGDIFWGIKVPVQRRVAQKYLSLSLSDIAKLLESKVHELRLIGVIILVEQFKKAKISKQEKIYKFYLEHTKGINNWDLVDLSAPQIVGRYLFNKSKIVLKKLSSSKNLWERRIAIVATLTFIRNNDFKYTLFLAKKLLNDEHDLIHKAVGWMLREVGKRDEKILTDFLDKYSTYMPRVMLRYSIERLTERKRMYFLKKRITK